MPGGGAPAAAAGAAAAHKAAAAAPADSLPAHLLAKIAAVVLARAESALVVDGTNRCRVCQRHLDFRCACLQDRRAGTWSDIIIERRIGDCVHGFRCSASESLWPELEQRVAYREALLGTVQRMREVNKFWRDCVSYDLIDHLSLRGQQTFLLATKDQSARFVAAEALAVSWPADFSQRFVAVKTLDLSGTYLQTLPDGIREMPELRCLVLTSVGMGALPHWMAELRLTELRLSSAHITSWSRCDRGRATPREPTTEEKQASDTLVQRQPALEAWLWSAETRLPITLESLTLEYGDTVKYEQAGREGGGRVRELPLCIRYLTNLRSLSFQESDCSAFEFDLPEWLSDLPHLTSFQHPAHASHQSATVLGRMSLECLDIYTHEEGNWVVQLPALLAPENAIRTSLRVLRFNGDEVMKQLPLCLCHLQLTALDLNSSQGLSSLPEWLGEMPLVYLGLEFTGVSRLPVSLRRVATLRLICTSWSPLGLDDSQKADERLEAINSMEAELLPLSAAVQQLKFEINDSDLDGNKAGWCGGVWDPIVQPQLLEELRAEIQEGH
jgi:hypothetical protein